MWRHAESVEECTCLRLIQSVHVHGWSSRDAWTNAKPRNTSSHMHASVKILATGKSYRLKLIFFHPVISLSEGCLIS